MNITSEKIGGNEKMNEELKVEVKIYNGNQEGLKKISAVIAELKENGKRFEAKINQIGEQEKKTNYRKVWRASHLHSKQKNCILIKKRTKKIVDKH